MTSKLGIIAGKGTLPTVLIESCKAQSRPFHVVAVENAAQADLVEPYPHDWCRLGAIGTALDILKRENVEEIVMAGRVERPPLAQLRPDLKATQLLAKLGSSLLKGDDTLLRAIIDFFEKEGFIIVGAHEVSQNLLAPAGRVGKHDVSKKLSDDISFATRIARDIGRLDIGQAVIVQNQQVIGIEGLEGTDALIQRCAALKVEEKGGVLVKLCKPQQDRRVDLPTIGVTTIEHAIAAKLSGVVIEAGQTLILDRDALVAKADKAGLFVLGYTPS